MCLMGAAPGTLARSTRRPYKRHIGHFATHREAVARNARYVRSVNVSQSCRRRRAVGRRAGRHDMERDRAAIVEFDGNVAREWAEGFAGLDPERPPAGVSLNRWQRFVEDVGLFLRGPFCAVEAALGWGPYDLFGHDPERPLARLDIWASSG